MTAYAGLDEYLSAASAQSAALRAVGTTIQALAEAGRQIAGILAQGPLAGRLSEVVGSSLDGDGQKTLDVMTHDIVRNAMARCPVAVFASEEAEAPEVLNAGAALAVAVDPLDGSSNIDTLAPLGTIFSILPALAENPAASFLRSGRHQLAAGFLIYGPRTALALTLGDGTRIFTLDPQSGRFITAQAAAAVPETTREYAINSSNFYHWEPEISAYIVELMQGQNGPRGEGFNTRWLASMVADAYRILIRGGIYLYPGDQRPGYRKGRLRLVYEANPVAFLMEQAGGAATDGRTPVLDLVPGDIHARCPLIFGAAREVARVQRAYAAEAARDAPLFKTRSLFRKTHALGPAA